MTDRINRNPPEDHRKYGDLDEIVMVGCTAHLEQLSHRSWYLGLTRGEEFIQVWIFRDGKSVKATFEDHRSDTP